MLHKKQWSEKQNYKKEKFGTKFETKNQKREKTSSRKACTRWKVEAPNKKKQPKKKKKKKKKQEKRNKCCPKCNNARKIIWYQYTKMINKWINKKIINKCFLNLLKCLIYHFKDRNFCLRRVWIRLTTAYLLCAREFRQNNALPLQFWCLSNALTLRVRALDASRSQHACIILSKFSRKSKYAVMNL